MLDYLKHKQKFALSFKRTYIRTDIVWYHASVIWLFVTDCRGGWQAAFGKGGSVHAVNTCVWFSLTCDCLPCRLCIWWCFQTLSQTSCLLSEGSISLWLQQDVLKYCMLSIQGYLAFFKGGQIVLWIYGWMNILRKKLFSLLFVI